jgi:putative inorganic carbon (HCO3(-)) transporter
VLRTLFVITILVPGVVAAVRNRFAALLMYIWFALFRPQDWMWIDITSLRLSLVLGLILVVPSILSGILPNVTHPLSLGAIAFFFCGLIAQVNAFNAAVGWHWLDYLGRLVLVCLLTVTLVTTRERFVLMVAVIAGSLGFHAAKAGLASVLGGGLRFYDGMNGGSFVDNNGYALGAAMVLFLLIGAAQNLPHRMVRRAFYVAAPLTAFTVLSTFSRGGFLAAIGSTIVFVALQRRRFTLGLGLAAAALAGYLVLPIPEGYFDRVQTIQTYEEIDESSALSRLHFWRVAVNMAKDHPLGIGLRNFESAYDRYDFLDGKYGIGRAVHSSHFQVLAETGFAGAAVYLTMFGYAFIVALRVRSRSKDPSLAPDMQRFLFTSANALMASMAAFLVGGSFIALALNDITWYTFALVASLDRISLDACPRRALSANAVTALDRPRETLGRELQPAFTQLRGRSTMVPR